MEILDFLGVVYNIYEVPLNSKCSIGVFVGHSVHLSQSCQHMAGYRAIWTEVCGSGVVVEHVCGTFDLVVLKVIWVFWLICLEMASNSKKADQITFRSRVCERCDLNTYIESVTIDDSGDNYYSLVFLCKVRSFNMASGERGYDYDDRQKRTRSPDAVGMVEEDGQYRVRIAGQNRNSIEIRLNDQEPYILGLVGLALLNVPVRYRNVSVHVKYRLV